MSEANEAKKVFRSYGRKAISQGWRVEEKSDGWIFWPPDKSKAGVTLHKTPNRGRWQQNFRSEMKRSGFKE